MTQITYVFSVKVKTIRQLAVELTCRSNLNGLRPRCWWAMSINDIVISGLIRSVLYEKCTDDFIILYIDIALMISFFANFIKTFLNLIKIWNRPEGFVWFVMRVLEYSISASKLQFRIQIRIELCSSLDIWSMIL